MDWVWASVAIIGGFVGGTALSRLTRNALQKRRGRLEQMASAAASLIFSLVLVIGLLVALGFVQPDSLEKLRDDTIDYLPRAISALIVVILGGVVGTIASTTARESIGPSMGRLGEQIPTLLKGITTTFAIILAASQLGIETTVINIAVAAASFGLALAFALIIGFGSRPIATEIASGRALRRLITPGDTVTSATIDGTIVAMHPTAVEININSTTTLVPNTQLSDTNLRIKRPNEQQH